MTNTEIIKKTLEYNKTAFENVFKTVSTAQEEGRKVAGEALEKATFIPAEGKAVVQQWLAASKEAGEKFRESVLKGHEQIEKILKTA